MTFKDVLKAVSLVHWRISEHLINRKILSLCQNSKYATPDCLFFCKVGAITDGHLYAKNAYDNGARCFIVERDVDLPSNASVIKVKSVDEELKRLSLMFYGDPAKDMTLIGITGTKGKTTIALSVYNIASACGIPIGYIGTNGVYYGGRVFETANTTPDVLELQKILREMRDCGITTVVIEVSSQALWQERTYGLRFKTCVFTNLYRDHIGGVEHPTFGHYIESKRRLFTDYGAENIIINADSPESRFMIEGVTCNNLITTSAKGDESCDLFARSGRTAKDGIRPGIEFECFSAPTFNYSFDEHGLRLFVPLPGLYSVENALLTIAVCLTLGIDAHMIAEKLLDLRVSGRFESVDMKSKPNSLFIIDYAHNGASLSAVLKAMREYEPARIICLFGSVGGRTFERRGELARAADADADVIIITSDNPNNEDPMQVIEEIHSAITDSDKPIFLIPDRKEAIRKAYELAEDGDFVLLAGKGHETYQLIKGERVPFSERMILEQTDLIMTPFNI